MAELKIIRMSDIQPEQTEWLWKPYIPQGAITLLQGDGGLGKTYLSLVIAAAVSLGEPIVEGEITGGKRTPSRTNPVPTAVIVQNGEDSYTRTIKPRLEGLGADCEIIYSINEEDEPVSFADERIEQIITRTNASLIVIDPLQAFFGKSNMNAAGSVRPIMKNLGKVAERTGCAILLVGHLGKRKGKGQYRGLGSVDIYAVARSVLTVGTVDEETGLRAMVHNKSNLAPSGQALSYTLDPENGFCWRGEIDITLEQLLEGKGNGQTESQLNRAKVFIEDTLRHGSVPSAEILEMAEEQTIAKKTLQRAKEELGVISTKPNGVWCWELPIDVEYDEVEPADQDGQGSQHSQDSHNTTFGYLDDKTQPNNDKHWFYQGSHHHQESQGCQDSQSAHMATLTNLTTFPDGVELDPTEPDCIARVVA